MRDNVDDHARRMVAKQFLYKPSRELAMMLAQSYTITKPNPVQYGEPRRAINEKAQLRA